MLFNRTASVQGNSTIQRLYHVSVEAGRNISLQCDISNPIIQSDGRLSRAERSSEVYWLEYIEGGSRALFLFDDNDSPKNARHWNFHLARDPHGSREAIVLDSVTLQNEGIYGCYTPEYDIRWNLTVTSKSCFS